MLRRLIDKGGEYYSPGAVVNATGFVRVMQNIVCRKSENIKSVTPRDVAISETHEKYCGTISEIQYIDDDYVIYVKDYKAASGGSSLWLFIGGRIYDVSSIMDTDDDNKAIIKVDSAHALYADIADAEIYKNIVMGQELVGSLWEETTGTAPTIYYKNDWTETNIEKLDKDEDYENFSGENKKWRKLTFTTGMASKIERESHVIQFRTGLIMDGTLSKYAPSDALVSVYDESGSTKLFNISVSLGIYEGMGIDRLGKFDLTKYVNSRYSRRYAVFYQSGWTSASYVDNIFDPSANPYIVDKNQYMFVLDTKINTDLYFSSVKKYVIKEHTYNNLDTVGSGKIDYLFPWGVYVHEGSLHGDINYYGGGYLESLVQDIDSYAYPDIKILIPPIKKNSILSEYSTSHVETAEITELENSIKIDISNTTIADEGSREDYESQDSPMNFINETFGKNRITKVYVSSMYVEGSELLSGDIELYKTEFLEDDIYVTQEISETTITSDIASDDKNIPLASVASFPASGVVYIGGEAISYPSISGPVLIDVERGERGTLARWHGSGSKVYLEQRIISSYTGILYGSMSYSATSLKFIKSGDVEIPSSGNILLKRSDGVVEIISYTEKVEDSNGVTLSGLTRGARSTEAVDHDDSAVYLMDYMKIGDGLRNTDKSVDYNGNYKSVITLPYSQRDESFPRNRRRAYEVGVEWTL